MSWVALSKPWQDTSVEYCDVCGNLLIHRFWQFSDGDRVVRACRPDDEQLLSRLRRWRAGSPFPAGPGGA